LRFYPVRLAISFSVRQKARRHPSKDESLVNS
jgi:hypothetical protein